jgi:hypothetical protein
MRLSDAKTWLVLALIVAFAMGNRFQTETPASIASLAGKIAVELESPGVVSIEYRNFSSLDAADTARIRRQLETELRRMGYRIQADDGEGATVRITFSQRPGSHLVVAEVRRNGDRAVAITDLGDLCVGEAKREQRDLAVRLQFLWEQDSRILDTAWRDDRLLLLDSGGVRTLVWRDGRPQVMEAAAIASPQPWPRDLRGRLAAETESFRAFLPGLACQGQWSSPLRVTCRESEDAWPLTRSDGRRLHATLSSRRNFFAGSITSDLTLGLEAGPFFCAGLITGGENPVWVFSGVDGTIRFYDATAALRNVVESWSSELVVLSVKSNRESCLLSVSDDGEGNDSLQAFRVVGYQATPASEATHLAGRVTALWDREDGKSATLVTMTSGTGRYAAYRVELVDNR